MEKSVVEVLKEAALQLNPDMDIEINNGKIYYRGDVIGICDESYGRFSFVEGNVYTDKANFYQVQASKRGEELEICVDTTWKIPEKNDYGQNQVVSYLQGTIINNGVQTVSYEGTSRPISMTGNNIKIATGINIGNKSAISQFNRDDNYLAEFTYAKKESLDNTYAKVYRYDASTSKLEDLGTVDYVRGEHGNLSNAIAFAKNGEQKVESSGKSM